MVESREGIVRTGRAAKVRVRNGLGRRRLERWRVEKGSKRVSDDSSGVSVGGALSVEAGGWSEEEEFGYGRSNGVLPSLNERGGWVSMGGRSGVSGSYIRV